MHSRIPPLARRIRSLRARGLRWARLVTAGPRRRPPWAAWQRTLGLLGGRASDARQGLAGLALASAASLVAGVTLGSMTNTVERLPGLLILVPAAIGMRGAIFGALGARLGTQIHIGEFGRPLRPDSRTGQSVTAAAALTLYMSVCLAVLAWGAARLLEARSISFLDFLAISVVGGVLSSVVVLAATVGVASLSVRRGYDLDNVAAPVVTATGDVVTLPALWAATFLLPVPLLPESIGVLSLALLVALILYQTRPRWLFRRIVAQSLPILLAAGTLDVLAGYTIDRRAERFLDLPALLVLIPPFLEEAGALGGILSARLSSKLHLGLLQPGRLPGRGAWGEVGLTYLLAVPVFVLVALSATAMSVALGLAHPGLDSMLALSLIAGALATTAAVLVAYYTAVTSYRAGLDPDNYGIPTITSTIDLGGTLALIVAIIALGLA